MLPRSFVLLFPLDLCITGHERLNNKEDSKHKKYLNFVSFWRLKY